MYFLNYPYRGNGYAPGFPDNSQTAFIEIKKKTQTTKTKKPKQLCKMFPSVTIKGVRLFHNVTFKNGSDKLEGSGFQTKAPKRSTFSVDLFTGKKEKS